MPEGLFPENIILGSGNLNIEKIINLQQKPLPFTPGEPLFWNDPHISKQMLATHLDPNTDLASRRPETIDRSVAWIVKELGFQRGDAILDLGCGPGLYSSRLAKNGFSVTGVDYSESSIEYAKQYALEHNLQINYRYQDYLELEDRSQFDAALLIYGDLCPLSPEQRRKLLANIYRALKPHGSLVLDVSKFDPSHADHSNANWYSSMGGFWRPGPHIVLERSFSYPGEAIQMDQHIVIEQEGAFSVYRLWRQEYTPESITAELKAGGFEIQSMWDDLIGTPYTEATEWIGIVARKN